MSLHKDQVTTDIHVPYRWTFADSSARAAATDPLTSAAYASADVGKLARQSDNNTLYMLLTTTPTWIALNFIAENSLSGTTIEDETVTAAKMSATYFTGTIEFTGVGTAVFSNGILTQFDA